ncbi:MULTISPECIES: hypothetical protein [Mesorhizobium]|uniref:hypothetical protein n=1 Tax=Mesorhizobium TaxID=68287 RepID=UPI001011682F|nr:MULTISPECIES: hypothetical protein [Mesorhizobium]
MPELAQQKAITYDKKSGVAGDGADDIDAVLIARACQSPARWPIATRALLSSFIRSLPPLDERGRIQNILRIFVMPECAWKGGPATGASNQLTGPNMADIHVKHTIKKQDCVK